MKPKRLWFYFQNIVTLGLVFVLLRSFDWASFGTLIRQIPLWFYPLAIVILCFVLLVVIYHTLFAFAGSDMNVLRLMAALMSIVILTNIPISVNGIGLREQLHGILFANLGIQRKEVSISIWLIMLFDLTVISVAGYVLRLGMNVENRPPLDPHAESPLSGIQTKVEP